MKKGFIIRLLIALFSIFLCFGFIACDKEEEKEETITPQRLGVVQLMLEDNVVSWAEIQNAVRYAYQINNEEIVETTLRYVALEDGDKIRVKAVGDGKYYIDGGYSSYVTYLAPDAPTPVALGTVVVSLNENVATWSAVANASRYAYQIDDGEVIETTAKAVVLQNGETIRVKALGDNVYYTDGVWSNSVQYTYVAPADPETPNYNAIIVEKTINEGDSVTLASVALPSDYTWKIPTAALTASGYYDAYYKGDIAATVYVDLTIIPAPAPVIPETPNYNTIVVEKTINEGDSVTLASVALPSDYTWKTPTTALTASGFYDAYYKDDIAARVYVDLTIIPAPAPIQPDPIKLGDVVVTLSGHKANWDEVDYASRYAYQINNEDVVETTLCYVVLSAGDSIKVKAIGDGENYADGDYCAAVVHNTIYDGPINDGAVELTLNEMDTATCATATTDSVHGTFIDSVLKATGEASFGVYYRQTASVVIPLVRNGEPMTQAKLTIYDELRVWVLVPIDSNYANIVPTFKVGSQTFAPSTLKDGWNQLKLDVDTLIADGFISSITINVSQNTATTDNAPYILRVDSVSGVYNEKLDIGNVMIFGDSYSTFEGYLNDPRFYYYAEKPVAQTDLTKVEQTWWGQVLSNTNSNLVMNNSVSGSTICGTTYGLADAPQDTFVERMDALISNGYFERNRVDTFLIFGGTNDSWGMSPLGEAKYSGWTATDKTQVLPSICYMVAKAMEVAPNAQIIVILNTFENLNDSLIPAFKPTPCDYQTPIINAVKGFAEFGTKVHVVALNDHENNNINLMGLHPTVSGANAIADQVLNIMYERAYLAQEDWTHFGGEVPSVKETVIQDFSVDIGYHYNATVEVVKDAAYTKDGTGSWKVTELDSSIGGCYLIGQVISSLDAYSQVKVTVYANEAAAGTSIYLDLANPLHHGTLLGTVQAGWNEFTIDASVIQLTHPDAAPHIRLAFHIANVGGALYFDSIIGITK